MRVEFEYSPALVIGSPSNNVTMPPHFSIWLKWEPAVDKLEWLNVNVGQHVEVILTDTDPVLLVGVDGLVPDLAPWRLVPEVVGSHVWERAVTVIEQELLDQYCEVEVEYFDPVREAWRDLQLSARSGGVKSMHAKSEGDRLYAALQSDPALWEAYLASMSKAVDDLSAPD